MSIIHSNPLVKYKQLNYDGYGRCAPVCKVAVKTFFVPKGQRYLIGFFFLQQRNSHNKFIPHQCSQLRYVNEKFIEYFLSIRKEIHDIQDTLGFAFYDDYDSKFVVMNYHTIKARKSQMTLESSLCDNQNK